MCQSYKKKCHCGSHRAEIFFGNMVLNESSVTGLFCPECSPGKDDINPSSVWDNGWVLELNMDIVRAHASTFGLDPEDITADWTFDSGYATWVGITPDDTETRNQERDKIQQLAKTDILAYMKAMKEWGTEREKRFSAQGWRKVR